MIKRNKKVSALWRRKTRIRSKLKRLSKSLRLSVFRSNKHIYCQVIDDKLGKTILSASDQQVKKVATDKKITQQEIAKQVGMLVASLASKHKIKQVYFDRSGYKFHGLVKALAEGVREGGLKI
jgi:large subunit ribosomal protein L18